jgi:hypothetical protein
MMTLVVGWYFILLVSQGWGRAVPYVLGPFESQEACAQVRRATSAYEDLKGPCYYATGPQR